MGWDSPDQDWMYHKRLNFTERTEGMYRAVEHADREVPDWSDSALAYLRRFAQARVTPFLIEEVIATCKTFAAVPEPPTTKAWGAVVKRAQREGWLQKDGFAVGKGNACAKVLWRHV